MARKPKAKKRSADFKGMSNIDSMVQVMMNNIDPGYSEREGVNSRDRQIQKIVDSELDLVKGISNNNFIDTAKNIIQKNKPKTDGKQKDVELFSKDIDSIYSYYEEMYKNRYIAYSDLKFISKFVPVMGAAVRTTLDGIVSADDISDSITRNLIFATNLNEEEKVDAERVIKQFEKELDLLPKLKNVFTNTLVTGNHYVYAIPYKELFEEYKRLVNTEGGLTGAKAGEILSSVINERKGSPKSSPFMTKAAESFSSPNMDAIVKPVMESAFNYDNFNAGLGSDFTESDKQILRQDLENNMADFTTIDSHVIYEALEGYASKEIMNSNLSAYSRTFQTSVVVDQPQYADGTADAEKSTKIRGKFDTVGTYIKYIHADKIVPVDIHDEIIGYFYVHDTSASKKSAELNKNKNGGSVLNSSSLFTNNKVTDMKKDKAARAIIDNLTEGIIKNFSPSFVNLHSDFKHMIADCIVANGLVNNAFKIQFIPAKYIIPFTVNENESNIGESILTDALFPAKLRLSLTVNKLLLFFNNGGNKTISYVRKGPFDNTSSNHTQEVLRMMQEGNLTFGDLVNVNSSFSKFNRNKNIQMPMAANGDRLVDFETQEGQHVEMTTDLEEWLERQIMVGLSVPELLMEYNRNVEVARGYSSAHIQFAGRIANLQSSLETSATKLYKVLIEGSSLSDDIKRKVLEGFTFSLCRPKVLSNTNISDHLNNAQSSIETIKQLLYGDSQDEDVELEKTEFNKLMVRYMLPFANWDEIADFMKQAKLKVIENKNYNNSMGDMGGGDDEY